MHLKEIAGNVECSDKHFGRYQEDMTFDENFHIVM